MSNEKAAEYIQELEDSLSWFLRLEERAQENVGMKAALMAVPDSPEAAEMALLFIRAAQKLADALDQLNEPGVLAHSEIAAVYPAIADSLNALGRAIVPRVLGMAALPPEDRVEPPTT